MTMVLRAREGEDSFLPGSHLSDAIRETLAMAKAGNMPVETSFNGTPIFAQPSDTFEEVDREYSERRRAIQARREAERAQAALAERDRDGLIALLDDLGMGYGLHDQLKRQVLTEWADHIVESEWLTALLVNTRSTPVPPCGEMLGDQKCGKPSGHEGMHLTQSGKTEWSVS